MLPVIDMIHYEAPIWGVESPPRFVPEPDLAQNANEREDDFDDGLEGESLHPGRTEEERVPRAGFEGVAAGGSGAKV